MLDRLACGPLYSQNYYLSIEEKNRTYYEVYSLPVSEHPPEGYQAISLVCVRQDGRYESPATVSNVCRVAKKRVDGMESFHFHQLRHTFTSNLLSYGAAPQEAGGEISMAQHPRQSGLRSPVGVPGREGLAGPHGAQRARHRLPLGAQGTGGRHHGQRRLPPPGAGALGVPPPGPAHPGAARAKYDKM